MPRAGMAPMTKARKHYDVTATREPGWWVLSVEIGGKVHATQARRLDQADAMVRDLIAIWTEASPDSFEISIARRIPEDLQTELEHARQLRVEAEKLNDEASERGREVARHLAEAGFSLRDVGALLGVSFQRAGQLVGQRTRR